MLVYFFSDLMSFIYNYTRPHYLALYTYIYLCTSSHIIFHTLIFVDTLDANLGNSHILARISGMKH